MKETDRDARRTPAVSEVLALQQHLREAALSGDVPVIDELLSQHFVVNLPSNRVAHRDTLLEQYSSGAIDYSSVDDAMDYAAELADDLVVVMGTERTIARSIPPDADLEHALGKTLHRRYTNVWRKERGDWRIL
ncbi:MAG: nuclear transport factor 2 family protein, partial [Gammaproteobacteria bacterium]